jgi:hypothetical protein
VWTTSKQKGNQTRKNRLILRETVGVWNCESMITSRAATVHVSTLLASSQELAAGITNVAALLFLNTPYRTLHIYHSYDRPGWMSWYSFRRHRVFNRNCGYAFESLRNGPILHGADRFAPAQGQQSLL